jgi:hypothetical protein
MLVSNSRMLILHFLAAGSFTIAEDMKPRVINLDFPALPAGTGRSQRLVENGRLALFTSLDDRLT